MSIYFGEFQPHKVANTGLYIQRKDSTVSLCEDYSSNGYDFTQGVAANQPSLGPNSIDFSTNDFMLHSVSDAFVSDNSGYIFFSGYFNNAAVNRIFTSADNSVANKYIELQVTTGGLIRFSVINTTSSIYTGNTVISNGAFYHGWIHTNGTTTTMMVNGISQTVTITGSAALNGQWFNDVSGRDNLAIGAIILSTPVYGSAQINKVHYVSGSPSAIDVWKIEQFMSNPLNYI
jgi:hypothetical protein